MNLEDLRHEAVSMTKWERHRFLLLIGVVIAISMMMVSVALSLYNSSGAAQLDLSRPDYQDVRNQAKRDMTSTNFPSTGKLDSKAFESFNKLYQERTGKVISVESFDSTALSEDSLQLLTDTRTSDTGEAQ